MREARNEIKKLKSKNANETAAHRERVEKTAAQGKAVMLEDNQNHKEHLEYWGKKWSRLQSKMAQQGQQHKLALAKMVEKNQQHEVRLIVLFSFHFLHLPLFLSSCLISISLFISVGC